MFCVKCKLFNINLFIELLFFFKENIFLNCIPYLQTSLLVVFQHFNRGVSL